MTKDTPSRDYPFLYFEWLLHWVCDSNHPKDQYWSLLEHLFLREYTYTLIMDNNRERDGLSLRDMYNKTARKKDILSSVEMSTPCSVLEVLIALSMRIESDILANDVGGRTSVWFWTMMENMDLHVMDGRRYDSYYINNVIDKFLDRKYGPEGQGGPFYIPYTTKDLRTVELWYQAMWYITANYA
jgi:hypothetical protein